MNFKSVMISIIVLYAHEAGAINVTAYFAEKDEQMFGFSVEESIYKQGDRNLLVGWAANLRSVTNSSGKDSPRYQGIPYLNIEKSLMPGLLYSNKFGVGVDSGEYGKYGFYYMSSSIKIDNDPKSMGFSTFGVQLNINDNRFEKENYKIPIYDVSPFIGFGF